MAEQNQHPWDENRPLGPSPFDRTGLIIIAAAVLIAVAGLFLVPALAGGQTALVTDYDNYPATPQAQLGAGCDGGGLYHSELFSLNGGPTVSDPHDLPEFNAGDTVTMTWNATTPECVGSPIVLDIKVSDDPFFDVGDDQKAFVPYAEATADGGPGSVSFTMPSLTALNAAGIGRNCAYQLDAIVGLPLAIVGPSGSDYSAGIRSAPPINKPGSDDRTTLIKWRNGAYQTCVAEETTTTTTAPTTTTSTTPVSSTVPTTADTTPTCVAAEAGVDETSLSPARTGCVLSGGTEVEASGAGAVVGARPASSLPTTGASEGLLLFAAVALILVGSGVVHIGRKAKR